jgi:hypothetical protein
MPQNDGRLVESRTCAKIRRALFRKPIFSETQVEEEDNGLTPWTFTLSKQSIDLGC